MKLSLLKWETKRILQSKTTWIFLSLAVILSALLAYLPVTYCYSNYTDANGNEVHLTGRASIAYEKTRQAGVSGEVTPEKVQKAVETYQNCLKSYGVTESYDLPEGVYEREILPIAPLLHGVKEAFADAETGMAPPIMEINPAKITDYYTYCEQRLTNLMRMEQPDSPSAQRKAAEMYKNVTKPFQVYPGMGTNVLDYQNIMGFLVLFISVMISAPIFSTDYQTGADDILRCTKHGRIRLGLAKITAPILLSGALYLLCAFVFIVTENSIFGWECTKTSIQMLYSIVTLIELDIGGLQLFFAFAGLLSVLATVSLTLYISSRSKSATVSLALATAFSIVPVVVYMAIPGTLSLWLCSVLPASGTSIQASILYALTEFKFLNIGNLSIWTPWAILLANIIEIPLFLFLTVHSYSKHAAA